MHVRPAALCSAALLLTFAAPLLAPLGTNPLSPRLAWSQPVAGQVATPYDTAINGQPPSATTFAAYAQRADYFIKRHQAKAALADATKAFELAPQIPATTPGYNANLVLAYAAHGQALVETNLETMADDDFAAALQLEPQNVALLVALARTKGGIGYRWKPDIEAALALDPKSPAALTARAALNLRSRTFFRMNDEVRAILRDYDAALAADPKYAPAYYERSKARARYPEGENVTPAALAAARADLDQAIALDPLFPLYYEERALRASREQPAQALADYSRLIALEPGNPERYLARARFQKSQRQPDSGQMKTDYDQAVTLELAIMKDFKGNDYARISELNRLGDALTGRGRIALQQNALPLALADFDAAIKASRYNIEAVAGRGLVLVRRGQAQMAVAEINAAMPRAREIQVPGALDEGLGARGIAYVALKQWQEALVDLNAAIKDDSLYMMGTSRPSQNGDYYFNRGLAYNGLKQPNKALDDFNIAAQLDPKFAAALKNTPYAARITPLEPSRTAVVDTSDTPTAHKLLGNEWRAAKNDPKALEEYNKALALDANYADAYNNRANIYKDRGRNDEALADFNKAIELQPTRSFFFYNRGVYHLDTGDKIKAVADLKQAAILDPTDSPTLNALGSAQQKAGQFTEAEATFRQLLALSDPEFKQSIQIRLILVRAAQNIAPTLAETTMLLALPAATLQRVESAVVDQLMATPDIAALTALDAALLAKIGE